MFAKIAKLTIAFALTAALSGCGRAAAAEAEPSAAVSLSTTSQLSPIRIGAVYALSGDSAAIGTNILRGIDYAVQEINKTGGVNGHPLEVVRADTRGDADRAASEAKRLIEEENVKAILGCHQSTATKAVFDVCRQEEIPALTAISTVDSLTEEENDYCFRLCPMNSLYFDEMFRYLSEQKKADGSPVATVAVFADQSLIGQEAIRDVNVIAPQYGMSVVAEITYPHGSFDLSQQVEQLKDAGADAVIAESYVSDAILFVKTLREENVWPGFLLAKANGFTDPSFLEAGIDADGLTSAVEWNADMVKGSDLNQKFRTIFGVDMNGHSAESYTAVWVLKTALENAEDLTGPSIAAAMKALDIKGSFPNGPEIPLPYDEIRFDDVEVNGVKHYNENVCASIAIARIENGSYVTVWPGAQTGEENE